MRLATIAIRAEGLDAVHGQEESEMDQMNVSAMRS